MKKQSSKYILNQRHTYSMYVLQSRALPTITDGLKAGARRVIWTARDGKKYKSATLAGAVIPIHPHAPPESTINTLAGPYINNITLLDGFGAFGTMINPTAFGSSRYTSVKISNFCKDVVLKDIEIIPLHENYDGTLEEPKHFLPLIPIVLLNPTEGIAVGFACSILSRKLKDIISSQIHHLTKNTKLKSEPMPYFAATNSEAIGALENNKWLFCGKYVKKTTSTVCITTLPYGITHDKFTNNLIKLIDNGSIIDYEDNSTDVVNIDVKFKRGCLDAIPHEEIMAMFKLNNTISENMNVINFDHESVWGANYNDIIVEFTNWRLEWYVKRYDRLKMLLEKDIQKYNDILVAINKNIGSVAKNTKSRGELKELLTTLEIVYVDYIADLPIYRFTSEEKTKVQEKLKAANVLMASYNELLSNSDSIKKVYVAELKEVLKKYTKERPTDNMLVF